jgi:hypothetical protein
MLFTLFRRLSALALLFACAPAFAQGVTTSALNGTVTDTAGEPLPGVNVIAVHQPSGAEYGVATRSDGRYNLRNLRVGGPYTLRFSFIGFQSAEQTGITLALGEDREINAELREEALGLDEVVVSAEQNAILSAENKGSATNVSQEEIERIPTINRSLVDFTRLTPQFAPSGSGSETGSSVGGQSSRFNNIQIDGAAINDGFGLESSGTPGGSSGTQPISIDAVQEFQVAISPYDVTQGNFSGGSINVVTKSGTNRFSGSGYFLGRNESFVGDFTNEDDEDVPFDEFGEFTTGLTLGGPIVRDKLFFFLSGELVRRDAPITAGFLDQPGANTFQANRASVQEVVDIARERYGRDVGSIDQFDQQTESDKLFGRLDYNINASHNATLRFNYVTGALDDGVFRSNTGFNFADRYYIRENTNTSSVFELNSLFGPRFANQFRLSLQTNRQPSTLQFAAFPSVEIRNVGAGDTFVNDAGETVASRGGSIRLGPDQFRGANNIDADIWELSNNFNIFAGDHVITLGTQNTYQSFSNLFIRNFYGFYRFESVEDFRAGRASQFERNYSLIDGESRPLADFSNLLVGAYAQDEWSVSDQLNLTLGLRVDVPFYPDSPAQASSGRLVGSEQTQSFEAIFGFDNSDTPGGNAIVSPRLGFNYAVDPERSTQIRGGAGVFAGRFPGVWISNSFSNDGSLLGSVFVRPTSSRPVAVDGGEPSTFVPFVADPDGQYTAGSFGLSEGSAEINLTDPDFRNPTNFRTNFAVDQALGAGFVGTAEVIYTNVIDGMQWQELNRTPFERNPNTVDGRGQSRDRVSNDYQSVILLTNTDEGYSLNTTVQLQKKIGQGILPDGFFSLAYTNSEVQDINSVTSSQARSNVRDLPVAFDVNNPGLATSNFEVRHRVLGTASYRLSYADRFATTATLLYDGRSGFPFSYTFDGDPNDDGFDRADLAFIPSSRDQLEVSDEDWQRLQAFIDREDLGDERGGIAERNIGRGPWQNFLDFSLKQEVFTLRGQRIELQLDVLNVLSLLGLSAGEIEDTPGTFDIADFDGYTDDGRLRLSNVTTASPEFKDDLLSRWQMQLGVRYVF